MTEFRHILLLVTLVNSDAGFVSVSGAGITLKYACQGESIHAFQNIDFDRCNSRIVLKVNGKKDTHIGSWSLQNCTLNTTLDQEYRNRVFLDINKGTITIHNLNNSDQGRYVVLSWKDKFPSIKETQIHVLVAPSKDCKPLIERSEDNLLARINDGKCGTPVATLYWKSNGGVSHTNGSMLKITPETESRTYMACIQGMAVQCAKNQMPHDYCSNFTIEGSKTDTCRNVSSESSNTVFFITVITVLGTLLGLAIVTIAVLILKPRRRNPNERHRYNSSKQTVEMQDLLREERHSTYVNESNDPEEWQIKKSTQSDATSMTEKASTKHGEKGHVAGLCTFCGKEKNAVFVLSCEHLGRRYIPTCIKCSSLPQTVRTM